VSAGERGCLRVAIVFVGGGEEGVAGGWARRSGVGWRSTLLLLGVEASQGLPGDRPGAGVGGQRGRGSRELG
jgi:hypothetical protein